MKAQLAAVLETDEMNISIKATTTENLDLRAKRKA
jgi:2C-methyl-D-erythritol 2,4-cyclodiphosphate synthase